MVWSCRASATGLQIIREACHKNRWKRDVNLNDEPLVLASKLLEPNKQWPQEFHHGPIYAEGINEASWRRFLTGKDFIRLEIFAAYCFTLEIEWTTVVEWPNKHQPIPLPLLPENLRNLNSKDDLDDKQEVQDISEFIADVTIPDGSIFRSGEQFTKIWAIRNAGNTVWENRYLTRMGPCSGAALITSPKRVRIPKTKPGEEIEISVKLKAPEGISTTTTAVWKMTFNDGRLCYPERYQYGLSVIIQVVL